MTAEELAAGLCFAEGHLADFGDLPWYTRAYAIRRAETILAFVNGQPATPAVSQCA